MILTGQYWIFRDCKKPEFEICQDELILTNTPIGSVEEVYEETINDIERLNKNMKNMDIKFLQSDNLFRRLCQIVQIKLQEFH
jgi:hypothetical protein